MRHDFVVSILSGALVLAKRVVVVLVIFALVAIGAIAVAYWLHPFAFMAP